MISTAPRKDSWAQAAGRVMISNYHPVYDREHWSEEEAAKRATMFSVRLTGKQLKALERFSSAQAFNEKYGAVPS